METKAYLGIGSNLNRDNALLFAVAKLKPLFKAFQISNVYESKPVREAEPDYFNMVVGGTTTLGLQELYDAIVAIEQQAGKELMMHNGTNFGLKKRVDIDILNYGNVVTTEPCKIPRHDIQDYPFVNFPLNEIAPELMHPILGLTVKELHEQMAPYIPDNRQVHKVDFDFSREAPDWQENTTQEESTCSSQNACNNNPNDAQNLQSECSCSS